MEADDIDPTNWVGSKFQATTHGGDVGAIQPQGGDDYGNNNNNEDSNAFSNPTDEYMNNSDNDCMSK